MHRCHLGFAAALALSVLAAGPAHPQADLCPDATVRLVVTFPAGGAADAIARILSDRLASQTGKAVVVENLAGAAGTLGTATVARAPANGCSVLVAFDTHVVNASLKPKLPYDAYKDFAGVTLVGTAPLVAVASAGSDMVDGYRFKARVREGETSFGSVGVGSLGHLAMTLIAGRNGFKLAHVPYRGGSTMVQDLLGSHLPLGIGSTPLLGQQIADGKVRALFVTGAERAAGLPSTPTAIELGLVDVPLISWWGLLVRAGTPRPVIERLHREVVAAMAQPDIRSKLDGLGLDVRTSSPEAFEAMLLEEGHRWSAVIQANQLQEKQ